MNKDTEKTLIWAGVGVGALLLLSKMKGTTTVLPGTTTTTTTGTPVVNTPVVNPSDPTHPLVYTYAQALAANPNQGNSNYNLTDAEAYQLMTNYLDLKQAFNNDPNKARDWWHHYGVSEKRIFLPWATPSTQAFGTGVNVEDSSDKGSSSGGGSWVNSALSVAGTLIAFLGVNDNKLSDYEKETLFMGGAIAKEVLPFYNSDLARMSEQKLAAVMMDNL